MSGRARRPARRGRGRVRWPRLRTLDRYVGLAVARSYVLVLMILLTLFSLLALIEELEDLGKGRYRLGDIVAFIALTMPRRALDLSPVAALLGSVVALGGLASAGELVAMQAAGISTRRVGWSVLKPGLLFMAGTLLAGEFVAPPLDQAAYVRRVRAMSAVPAMLSDQGFWSRDARRFLRVRHVTAADVLGGVEVYEFDDEGRLRVFLHARRADLVDARRWLLTDVLEKQFAPEGVTTRRLPARAWESFLGREQVDLLVLPASSLSLWDLYRYVGVLRAGGQDPARYQLALWQKVSMPLATGAMVLLAIPFVFGLLRVASAGQRMMAGTLAGITFHLSNQIVARVGLLLNLSPGVIALAPVAAVLVTALWLARRPY